MKEVRERSAGIILFVEEDERRYLVLEKKKSVDFPKGKNEEGETDRDAAIRETYEETGIKNVEFVPGFRKRIRYVFQRRGKQYKKNVTFFLGRVKSNKVKISKEHKSYSWLTAKEALKKFPFRNHKNLITSAEKHLSKSN